MAYGGSNDDVIVTVKGQGRDQYLSCSLFRCFENGSR